MEELKNCKLCGKTFSSNSLSQICSDCKSQEDSEFEEIREYIYQHPHSSIYDVATKLNVSINKIKHFLREGRIEIVEKDNQFLLCETCGKPIHSGWYCEDCLRHSFQGTKISGTAGSDHLPSSNTAKSKELQTKASEHSIRFKNK